MSMALSILPSEASSSRRPPSGSVTDWRSASPFTSMISRLPPPRSPARPSGERKPIMMPLAASSASRWPDRIWMRGAQRPLAAGDEVRPVGGIAAGGRGDRPDVLDAEDARDRLEAAQRFERALDAFVAEAAGRADLAAEAAQNLLVEDRRRAPDRALVDDEPHRVRADVDDADRLESRLRPNSPCSRSTQPCLSVSCSLARLKRRGKLSFSDCPRPDRLGLVMKYSCALNGSSPFAGRMRSDEPSARMRQLCWLSFRFATMIWSRICSCTVGLVIGTMTSTRRSRLRGIMSAELI